MAYSSVQNPITLTGGGEGEGGAIARQQFPCRRHVRARTFRKPPPLPSVFVLDSCRVPSVFNNALASRDYSYIPGALCFYIYLDIRWQRLPLQNCNCITEIKKKKKNPRYGLSDTCTNSIGGETDGGVPVSDGGWRERERNTRTGETGGITIFFFFFYSRERFLA